MRELNTSEVQMVSGGKADFSDVTAAVTSTAPIVSTCSPGASSA